jgi:KipI family sensor histidine kinase inhibitor
VSEGPHQTISETDPRIEPLGDGALLVTLGDTIDLALNGWARRLAAAVDQLRETDSRIGRPVPAYASVLVPFDPVAVDPEEAYRIVAELVADAGADDAPLPADTPRDVIEIPVRYGGTDGPDLSDVAELNGLRPSDVVELHAGTEYRAFFLGFAPGFAYLGPLADRIATPRLATPRERVPAGSVGIAGSQTGVYPFALPGGWRIIGHTDAAMWDPRRDPPSLLRPGDRVRFVPVG